MDLAALKEKRRHPRQNVPGKVKLRWVTSDHLSFQSVASCIDISATGIRLELDRAIEAGTYVHLESPQFHIAGVARVRHCIRRGLKYKVGIEFSGGLTWKDRNPA